MRSRMLLGVTIAAAAVLLLGASKKGDASARRKYPPLVFSSRGLLDCSISSSANGRQVMTTTSGPGFTFDAVMRPIEKGTVEIKGSGMRYKFDAFPVRRVKATFNALGAGVITEFKAEVEVDVKLFDQPGGPGTTISFTGADIDTDGAYVEFTGTFVRDRDHKVFPFRVLFGSSSTAKGSVTPQGKSDLSELASKHVELGTQAEPATVTTILYEEESDVRPLK